MYVVVVVEKTLPRAIIGVWNKKNRCFIKRLQSEETIILIWCFVNIKEARVIMFFNAVILLPRARFFQ